ncbi:hypothetical protein IL306_003012 [Fusarium sp. DS 682]|nr:hypothetical protein IL306_003012 [Fusarium sp. DS 682]
MPSLVQKDDVSQAGHSSRYNNTHEAGDVTVDSPGALEPTTYATAVQGESNVEEALEGAIMSMTEAVQTVAALPASVEAVVNLPRGFDAQSVYPGDACLFVANLPQHVNDLTLKASLTKHFGKFGTVFVKVKRDRIRHMPMAFVQYTQIKHADVAVHKARGDIIHGRPIRVEKCGGNLAYIVFRKNNRPVQIHEARSIFSRYGPIEKIEVLDHYAQTQLDVPPSLLVQFSRFDPKRDVIRDVGAATPFIIMAFDPKMVQKRSDRPADDHTFMELYEKDCRSVFFGGLPHYADESMVYRLAGICGNVRSVDLRCAPDQDGGLPHPWAFVDYDEFDTPDKAIREFHGKEVEGCFLRVERKRTKPTSDARTPSRQVIGSQMPDLSSRKLHGSTDDARMYPSPLRPIKRPHRLFDSRVASMAAAPGTHRRILSTAGISQEELEFLKIHRPQDILEPEETQAMNTQRRPLPVPKLPVPSSRLDEVTPVQSPNKYIPVADSGNVVRFAPSPGTLPSNAGSSPIPPQIPAPPAEFSPPNLRSFKEHLAEAERSGITVFSPAAELAAVRCEAAIEDKANGKGHRRAVSMFITTNNPPPIDMSESDDSTWRTSRSSQDEQEFRDKKAKSRNRLGRRHLSEENLKRNLLYQAKLKRAYASEENLRGRPVSRGTVRSRGKSGKSHKRSDATARALEGPIVVASQKALEAQPMVAAQQPMYHQAAVPYNHMVAQYPPTMAPMGYMAMQHPMAPAPGGFTYMDTTHHHPHAQFHEPIQRYQGPSQHQYAGPSQVPYPVPPPMYPQGQPQMAFQVHPQPDYREPIHMSQDARNYQHPSHPSHGGPQSQFQGRRHASYAHPQQMQYQGNYSATPHSNMAPIAPCGPVESNHHQRQRREAERYYHYNS